VGGGLRPKRAGAAAEERPKRAGAAVEEKDKAKRGADFNRFSELRRAVGFLEHLL